MLEKIGLNSLETILDIGEKIILVGHNDQHTTYGEYKGFDIIKNKLMLQLENSLNIPASLHIPSTNPIKLLDYIKSNQNIGNDRYQLKSEINIEELPEETEIYRI